MIRVIGILLFLTLSACQTGTPDNPMTSSPGTNSNQPQAPQTPEPVEFSPDILFFTFGDWGTGDASQQSVAEALKTFCQNSSCDFGVLLGDNFYPSGVDSVNDSKWQDYFEKVYSGLTLRFYPALGNHDHDGNAQAQIDYSALQDRWTMPARQFTISFPQGSPNPLLEIFVLDSDTYQPGDGDQLKMDLDNSSAQWKILALHHPLYSNGTHGDTDALKTALIPIICNKIDIVLSGHDHLFSHLEDPNDGCSFQNFVVGTGGKSLYPSNPDPRILFAKSALGFATLGIGPSGILLQFHETNGNIPYSFFLEK